MVKANKYLLAFTSIFLALTAIIFTVSQKLSPLLTHTAYYCQAFISSLSFKIPHGLKLLPVAFMLFVIAMSFSKLTAIVFSIQRLRKKLVIKERRYKKLDLVSQELNLTDKVYLVASHKPLAFCFGIPNPRIFVSTALVKSVTAMELKAILLHEKSHLANHDTATMLLATITESLFPFLPIISDQISNFIIDKEIKADGEAVAHLGTSRPLRSVLKKLLSRPTNNFAFVPSIGQAQTLEIRINTLINKTTSYKKMSPLNMFISFISLGLLSSLIIVPVNALALSSAAGAEDVMMVCLKSGECHRWCNENKSVIPPSNH